MNPSVHVRGLTKQYDTFHAVKGVDFAIFVATRLFRWEKDEKLKASAKLWVAGVLLPFVALGVYQFRTSEQIVKNRAWKAGVPLGWSETSWLSVPPGWLAGVRWRGIR